MRALHRRRLQLRVLQRHPLAVVVDHLAGEQAGGDLEGVLEEVEALARRREWDAELVVLLVEPGRAEGHLEPPMGDVIDGQRLGGVDGRMAVGHPGDEQAEADSGGNTRQGGDVRHALEHLARPVAVHGLEMVEAPNAVEAELFGELRSPHDLVPGHPLRRDVESEAHVSPLAGGP